MDWWISKSPRTAGTYIITTTSHKAGNQPQGWGLATWQKHGGKRNHASSWVYVHSGTHWRMDWYLEPYREEEETALLNAKQAKNEPNTDVISTRSAPKKVAPKEAAPKVAPKKIAFRRLLGGDNRRRNPERRRRHCDYKALPSKTFDNSRDVFRLQKFTRLKDLPRMGRTLADGTTGMSDAQMQKQHSDQLKMCCQCMALQSGDAFKGLGFKQTFEKFVSQNPAGTEQAKRGQCLRAQCVQNHQYYYQTGNGSWRVGSYSDADVATDLVRGERCGDVGGGWCKRYQCAVATVTPECVKCACVPECTSWIEAQFGPDSNSVKETRRVAEACKTEDSADFGCVLKALKSTFCIGPNAASCDKCFKGTNCSQDEKIVIAFMVYVADLLLGCAMGFIAQPSFWYNILPATSDKRTSEVQAARTAAAQLKDFKEGGSTPSDNTFAKANKEIVYAAKARRDSGKVGTKLGNTLQTKSVSPKDAALGNAIRNVEKAAVSSAQSNVPMKASMWKAMKGGLKNLVPCLPACLAGVAATIWFAGPVSIAAAASVFFGCMGTCVVATLGENLGFLVFELVNNCMWDILGEAVGSVCFPAHATVELQDGSKVAMKSLQVGDRVRSGEASFSEVYFFSHQLRKVITSFVQLTTDTRHRIELSRKHFILTSKNCDGHSQQAYAQDVQIGMCVFTKEQQGMTMSRVTQKSIVRSEGLYNPFTIDGSIVVDGVQASAHSDWFLDSLAAPLGLTSTLPSIYQAVLAPARWMYHAVGSEVARVELMKYQDTMNSATSEENTFASYIHLASRAVQILWQGAASVTS